MNRKGLGAGGWLVIAALAGCGSSGGSSGTGGTGAVGQGGSTGMGGRATGGHTGTGGATGGGGFTTSVPSGTKLTGLTGAQAAQLCSDLDTYFSHVFFPELCNGLATSSINGLETAYYDLIANPNATDAQLRADCTAASRDAGASDCLGQNFDAGVQNCDVSSIPATCQATVGDYAKCLNDTTAATVQFYATVPSCNTITAASLNAYFAADGGLNDGPSEPASCSMFDSTCSADGGTSPTGKMRSAVLHRRTR